MTYATVCSSIAAALLLCVPQPSHALDEWRPADTNREATYLVLHALDWGTTLDIVDHPDTHHEHNPVIGSHPTRGEVNRYMAITALAHVAIARILPTRWREGFQYITIGMEVLCVGNNLNLGLKVNF